MNTTLINSMRIMAETLTEDGDFLLQRRKDGEGRWEGVMRGLSQKRAEEFAEQSQCTGYEYRAIQAP